MLKRDIAAADLIQFTGGHDVSPELYGEQKHPRTGTNPIRDAREQLIFKQAHGAGAPMAGICRGAQFLNVMCGGKLWQDVDNHALGKTHPAWDTRTGEELQVTSTHHQMIIPGPESRVILVAKESRRRSRMNQAHELSVYEPNPVDVEALHYPLSNVFCFQPHPEFFDKDMLATAYFEYLDELLFQDKALHQVEEK